MKSLDINFESVGAQLYPVLQSQGREDPSLVVPVPVDCSYLGGGQEHLLYAEAQEQGAGEFLARQEWTRHGYAFKVSDRRLSNWSPFVHRPF